MHYFLRKSLNQGQRIVQDHFYLPQDERQDSQVLNGRQAQYQQAPHERILINNYAGNAKLKISILFQDNQLPQMIPKQQLTPQKDNETYYENQQKYVLNKSGHQDSKPINSKPSKIPQLEQLQKKNKTLQNKQSSVQGFDRIFEKKHQKSQYVYNHSFDGTAWESPAKKSSKYAYSHDYFVQKSENDYTTSSTSIKNKRYFKTPVLNQKSIRKFQQETQNQHKQHQSAREGLFLNFQEQSNILKTKKSLQAFKEIKEKSFFPFEQLSMNEVKNVQPHQFAQKQAAIKESAFFVRQQISAQYLKDEKSEDLHEVKLSQEISSKNIIHESEVQQIQNQNKHQGEEFKKKVSRGQIETYLGLEYAESNKQPINLQESQKQNIIEVGQQQKSQHMHENEEQKFTPICHESQIVEPGTTHQNDSIQHSIDQINQSGEHQFNQINASPQKKINYMSVDSQKQKAQIHDQQEYYNAEFIVDHDQSPPSAGRPTACFFRSGEDRDSNHDTQSRGHQKNIMQLKQQVGNSQRFQQMENDVEEDQQVSIQNLNNNLIDEQRLSQAQEFGKFKRKSSRQFIEQKSQEDMISQTKQESIHQVISSEFNRNFNVIQQKQSHDHTPLTKKRSEQFNHISIQIPQTYQDSLNKTLNLQLSRNQQNSYGHFSYSISTSKQKQKSTPKGYHELQKYKKLFQKSKQKQYTSKQSTHQKCKTQYINSSHYQSQCHHHKEHCFKSNQPEPFKFKDYSSRNINGSYRQRFQSQEKFGNKEEKISLCNKASRSKDQWIKVPKIVKVNLKDRVAEDLFTKHKNEFLQKLKQKQKQHETISIEKSYKSPRKTSSITHKLNIEKTCDSITSRSPHHIMTSASSFMRTKNNSLSPSVQKITERLYKQNPVVCQHYKKSSKRDLRNKFLKLIESDDRILMKKYYFSHDELNDIFVQKIMNTQVNEIYWTQVIVQHGQRKLQNLKLQSYRKDHPHQKQKIRQQQIRNDTKRTYTGTDSRIKYLAQKYFAQ